ncbi:hypothetical protein ACFCXK_24240 [Streptomyces sp. NPDC056269]|uniref:hypothetical protein n=1 Tax=Streptomyces sp. NPDC056269 TaxID=3345768 RepID=UPI0035E0F64C
MRWRGRLGSVTLAIDCYKAGGYDWETWNQLCDGLSHGAMNLMMRLSGPALLDMARDCEWAVRDLRIARRARAVCARRSSSR